MHCVAGSGYRSRDPMRGNSRRPKSGCVSGRLLLISPHPPHSLTSLTPSPPHLPHSSPHSPPHPTHSLPPHLPHPLTSSPPHPCKLMHTYWKQLEHSWQKVNRPVWVKEAEVYLTPARLTLDTLTSSRIVHRWQRVGWRVHSSHLSTHTAFSSLSSPPKAYQAGRGKGMSHILLPCVITLVHAH